MELLRLDVRAHRRVVGIHASVHEAAWRLCRGQRLGLEVRRRGRGRTCHEAHREVPARLVACLVAGEEPGLPRLELVVVTSVSVTALLRGTSPKYSFSMDSRPFASYFSSSRLSSATKWCQSDRSKMR